MRVADSPDWLESCANHPRVFPYIRSPISPFRFGHSWADCVGLEWPDGGVVFHCIAGVWDAHLLFLPGAREVGAKSRAALGHAFEHGAIAVTGCIPVRLRHARRVARDAGLKEIFTCNGLAYYRLARDHWHKERP